MENQKCADVAPLLEVLNEILGAEGTPRLHRLLAGGVVLATPDEAKALADASYL